MAKGAVETKTKDFGIVFQITRMIVFEVNYYHCGSNKDAHFSTSAALFNRPKTDYNRCGQAQDSLILGGLARKFYKKWDKKHLKKLSDAEYFELLEDLEELKKYYNYACINPNHSSFYKIKELSEIKKLYQGIEYV